MKEACAHGRHPEKCDDCRTHQLDVLGKLKKTKETEDTYAAHHDLIWEAVNYRASRNSFAENTKWVDLLTTLDKLAAKREAE